MQSLKQKGPATHRHPMKFSDTNIKREKIKSEWHAVYMLGCVYSEAADALKVPT